MSEDASQPTPQQDIPPFDPEAPHHAKPKLRPVRGFGTQAAGTDGQKRPVLGLADSKQISDKIVFTQPAMQAVLPLLDGEQDLDSVVNQVGRGLTREMLEQLVSQLDHAGLIEGPSFDAMYEKLRSDFDGSDTLPPGQSAAFAEHLVMQRVANEAGQRALQAGQSQEEAQAAARSAAEALSQEVKKERSAGALRESFEGWMNQALGSADDPSYDVLPRAVFVPFSPYAQGWQNYAHVYGRLRVVDRPDRIVVLGPNHFGLSSGVCAVAKSFETPLGLSPVDTAMLEAVQGRLDGQMGGGLGEALLEHQYDHEREHSIELQLPWLQHVFGGGESGEDGARPRHARSAGRRGRCRTTGRG
ncbi:MAG: AmmeMemoRadiSam system protein B, partial [Planctomycetota bacterium]